MQLYIYCWTLSYLEIIHTHLLDISVCEHACVCVLKILSIIDLTCFVFRITQLMLDHPLTVQNEIRPEVAGCD